MITVCVFVRVRGDEIGSWDAALFDRELTVLSAISLVCPTVSDALYFIIKLYTPLCCQTTGSNISIYHVFSQWVENTLDYGPLPGLGIEPRAF